MELTQLYDRRGETASTTDHLIAAVEVRWRTVHPAPVPLYAMGAPLGFRCGAVITRHVPLVPARLCPWFTLASRPLRGPSINSEFPLVRVSICLQAAKVLQRLPHFASHHNPTRRSLLADVRGLGRRSSRCIVLCFVVWRLSAYPQSREVALDGRHASAQEGPRLASG